MPKSTSLRVDKSCHNELTRHTQMVVSYPGVGPGYEAHTDRYLVLVHEVQFRATSSTACVFIREEHPPNDTPLAYSSMYSQWGWV